MNTSPGTHRGRRERMMDKVYVFGTEATAEAFKMTAYYFGYDGIVRIGSALVMSEDAYQVVMDNTYATAAAIVAEQNEVE